jgi:membrane-associated protein
VNPEHLLVSGGLVVLAAIVFAESGILAGFFLPGDSLLFIAGFLTSAAGGHRLPALPVVAVVAFVAAVAGDQVGYAIGHRLGPALFRRPDARVFRREHLVRATGFFERYGPRTIVLARFVPVVRTFVPVVAGATRMQRSTFTVYNLVGGLAWTVGVTTAGHFLGQVSFVRAHIDLALIGVVLVSVVPIGLETIRHMRPAAQ